MSAIALIFILAGIGISETSYLIRKRIALSVPVCPIGDNCSVVLDSKYNKIFGISNDFLGLLFYVLVSFVAAFLVIEVEPLHFWSATLKISVSFASLLSVYFAYVQWKIIKAWCFWCIMSACTIWLMAFIILASNQI